MLYVAMILSSGRHWLLMNQVEPGLPYTVSGWDSEEEATEFFRRSYQESAKRNGVNSTAVSWLFCRPTIVPIESDKMLKEVTVNEPVLTSVSGMGTHFMGIEVRPDMSDLLWARGKEIGLMDEQKT